MTADYILDAWAAVALLQGEEPAAGRVAHVMDHERAAMTWVNLGEVAYILQRRRPEGVGATAALALRDRLWAVLPADERLTLAAAQIKAGGGLSYADAFAAAAAIANDAVLLTGDPELLREDAPWRTEVLYR